MMWCSMRPSSPVSPFSRSRSRITTSNTIITTVKTLIALVCQTLLSTMARTKKIGLVSKQIDAPPTASRQHSYAPSNIQAKPTLAIAIETTRDCSEQPDASENIESATCFNAMTHERKTQSEGKAVKVQPTMPQASTFTQRSPFDIILTLSSGIRSTSSSGETSWEAQKTSLLDLPLELRTIIYNHVLAVDGNTYQIKHAHCTKLSEMQHRQNAHQVININPNHFALAAVNKQISEEVKASVPAKEFRFASTYALDNFLLTEKHGDLRIIMANLDILSQASKIEVVVGKRPFSRTVREHCVELFEMLAELLPIPVEVEFVDTEGDSQTMVLGL